MPIADRTSLEDALDGGAAAVLAAAAAFALAKIAPQMGGVIVAASAAIFAGSWAGLQRIPNRRRMPLPTFEPGAFSFETEPDELILTLDQIVDPAIAGEADELVLDDILDALEPDSRVVRLFAPGDLPTPGQLKCSIDRHLEARRRPGCTPDASQELSSALAELRRSLR